MMKTLGLDRSSPIISKSNHWSNDELQSHLLDLQFESSQTSRFLGYHGRSIELGSRLGEEDLEGEMGCVDVVRELPCIHANGAKVRSSSASIGTVVENTTDHIPKALGNVVQNSVAPWSAVVWVLENSLDNSSLLINQLLASFGGQS